MPVTVKFGWYFLVCGILQKSAPCFHVTNATQQRRIVEIELLATVGWQCGCRPFSCRCSQKGMHCRKEICSACLSKESIPAIAFWNSKHPIPTRSLRFLRAEVRSISSALWLHHAHPFVAAAEKHLSHAEKQRVWWRSCFLRDLFYIQWLCSQLCYLTAANQWTIVEIKLFVTVGWQCGCRPFSCRCSQKGMHCRKEICSACLSKESIPAIAFWNSKHPIPTRSLRFLRAEGCGISSVL